MLIGDISRGVFYQKCHDYECHGYRSEAFELPRELLPKQFTREQENVPDTTPCAAVEKAQLG